MGRYEAQTYVFDRQGYGIRQQNVTRWVDGIASKFRNASRAEKGGGTMYMKFPHSTPNLRIDDGMEVWHGTMDTFTGRWLGEGVFGGYIWGHKNTTFGWEHFIECNLVSYSFDIDTTEVISFPVEVDPRINPAANVRGFPSGYSVYQWLAEGSGEFAGLIPSHLAGVITTGIDSVYDQIIFQLSPTDMTGTLPTLSSLPGLFLTVGMAEALSEIADAAQFVMPDIEPHYFIKAVAIGDSIVPEFCFVDINNVALFDGKVFADMPEEGEHGMVEFYHERIPQGSRQRVTVVGQGLDPTIPSHPWVIATVAQAAHYRKYPTVYQKFPGRAGPPIINDRIGTMAEALDYATTIEQVVWGPQGRIGFKTKTPVRAGDYIWIRHTIQDINRAYPVQSAIKNGAWYEVVAGIAQKDLSRMTGTNMVAKVLRRHSQAWRAPYQTDWASMNITPPQSPPNSGIDKIPSAYAQNKIKAVLDTVPGLIIETAQNQSLTMPEGFNIDPSMYPTPTDPKKIVNNIIMFDKDNKPIQWADPNDGGHPHTDKIVIIKNGRVRVPVAEDWVKYVQIIARPFDTGATFSDFMLNGEAIPYPSLATPIECKFGDYIDFTVAGASGISATNPLTIMLTEKVQVATGGVPVAI